MVNRVLGPILLFVWVIRVVLPAERARLNLQPPENVVYIFAPVPGQTLQGSFPIEVSLIVAQLEAAYLEFRYANHPTGTWFLIAQVSESIPDGIIAQWDTTTISDGVYDLRLLAITKDQLQLEYLVTGLRVRNYSTIETDTPTPFVPTETLLPGRGTLTPSPTSTALSPTLTPLPTNPAILTVGQFSQSMARGSLTTLGVFLVIGLYLVFRTRFLRRF